VRPQKKGSAEQLKLNECAKKANETKVLIRDRAAFISGCVESNNKATSIEAVK
jgi:hypothetical protein